MKYAVIYKESYYVAGYDARDSGHTAYYDTMQEFEDRESLMKWITREESDTRFNKKIYRVIQFEELKVSKTIEIDLIK